MQPDIPSSRSNRINKGVLVLVGSAVLTGCQTPPPQITCFRDPDVSVYSNRQGLEIRYVRQNDGQSISTMTENGEDLITKRHDKPRLLTNGVINFSVPGFIPRSVLSLKSWSYNFDNCRTFNQETNRSHSSVEIMCEYPHSDDTWWYKYDSARGIVAFSPSYFDRDETSRLYLISPKGIAAPCDPSIAS